MSISATNNKESILTEDGKYKYCSILMVKRYFGVSYSKMRDIISIALPKRKRGLLSPKEVRHLILTIEGK